MASVMAVTNDIFCRKTHQHIDLNLYKSSPPLLALTRFHITPDSPDLTSCDYYLLPSMKAPLQGRCFASSGEVNQHRRSLADGCEKMAFSCTSRSYTNAGRSVSLPKETT
ncbi:hypothetical protein TNCV_3647661 [Trichonephila clavipes]|nr:hypothetical protein TNCV_3647661 [Trichonephila clavipes]